MVFHVCKVFTALRPMPVKRGCMFAVRVPRNDKAVGRLAVPEYSPLTGLKVGADVVVLVLHRFPDVRKVIVLAERQECNLPRAYFYGFFITVSFREKHHMP